MGAVTGRVSDDLGSLSVHDHACLICAGGDGPSAAVSTFIEAGLARGERCLYLARQDAPEAVAAALAAHGLDVAAHVRAGRLLVVPFEDACVRNGRFDPHAAAGFLQEAARQSREAGFGVVRVVGEAPWLPEGEADSPLVYEAVLDEFVAAHDALALCQYARDRLPAETLRDAVRSHTKVMADGRLLHNSHRVPPADLLGPGRAERELDRLLANLRDRQSLADRLQEQTVEHQQLLQTSVDAFLRMAMDGTVIETNAAFADMLGYPAEALPGMNVRAFQPQVPSEEVQRKIDEVAAMGADQFELHYRRSDGAPIDVAISAKRIDGPEGPCFVCFCRDVTDRRAMEHALRESERRYRTLLENTELLAVILDAEGRVTFCNEYLLSVTGWSREEILGRNWFELALPEEQRPAVRAAFLYSTPDGPELPARFENDILTRSGDRHTVAWNNTILKGPGGEIIGTASIGVDITNRKQAEAALRDSEERFRELAELLPEIVYEMDERGMLTFVNRLSHEITGYTREDFERGFRAIDLLVEEDRAAGVANIARVMRGGDVGSLEYSARSKDGRVFPVLSRSTVIMRDGRPVGLRGILIDITERKKVEQALRYSEARTRAILQAIPDLIFLQDKAGVYLEYHAADPTLLLIPAETFMGRNMRDVLPAEMREYFEAFDRTAATGETSKVEYPLDLDGVRRHFEARFVPSGEAVLTVVREITERCRAEEALVRARDFHLTLLEEFPSLVWRTDAQGRCDYVNRTWLAFTGRTREQEAGDGWAEGLHPDDRERAMRVHRAAFVARTPFELEYRLRRHDGEYRWVTAMGRPFDDLTGEFAGYVGSCYDITDRKRAEEERRNLEGKIKQTQKLESLGVLAGGIAHDFNNLLTGILGHADLALMELLPDSPAYDSIGHIETAARRAAELTKQLLAYSGKGRFVVSPVNLSTLVEEMGHLLEVSISKKCLIKYQFAVDLPAVDADATQLRQVAMNLIINASEAIGGQSGAITVRTGTVACDRAYLAKTYLDENLPEGTYVFLEVADTGCGMSEATRARIFDPFFTTKFTGRGLGLAAVLGIVRGHRGAIQVDSEPGRGTTFRVLLPASAHRAAAPDTVRIKAPSWRGSGTVLVVDDEDTVCRLATKMLEKAGFTVLTAADGQEGVEVFAEHADEIRAVLLDVTMPRMDGREAFHKLQALRPGIPVILSSGFNEQDATHHLEGSGLVGFVQKPYVMDELLQVLRRALEG